MSEETLFVNPEKDGELKKRKSMVLNMTESVDSVERMPDGLKVEYTAQGRFSIPSVLYWKDFTVEDVNKLAMTKQEDLLKVLINILNKIKNDESVRVEDMTYEEFVETLISLKAGYNTSLHEHMWSCDCQDMFQESDRKLSTQTIDLKSLSFILMDEADKELQGIYKDEFLANPESYTAYMKNKYPKGTTLKMEEELKNIKVEEPISFKLGNDIFQFRFQRVGDFVKAYEVVNNKYKARISMVESERHTNKTPSEVRKIRESKMQDIQQEMATDTIIFSKAYSMLTKNGQQLNDEQKVKEWRNMSRSHMFKIQEHFDLMNFGLHDERELRCNLCGKTKRGWLHQEFNIVELLPIQHGSNDENRRRPRLDIFTGV